MICGIGVDIVEIGRIEALIAKYGNHFLEKVYTPDEIVQGNTRSLKAPYFSGRWAAKEAFYKALHPGCQPYSFWKSIKIVSGADANKPQISVCCMSLNKKLVDFGIVKIHLSISHERQMCIATVILEG